MFAIVSRIVNDFLVRDRSAIRRNVFPVVNKALKDAAQETGDPSNEMWSDAEFEHKLDDALAGSSPSYPPGRGLRRETRAFGGGRTRSRLSDGFTDREVVSCVRDRVYLFTGQGYEEIAIRTSRTGFGGMPRRHAMRPPGVGNAAKRGAN